MASDPVCQTNIDEMSARIQTGQTLHGAMEVDPQKGTRGFHNGEWYYFCSLDCRNKFMISPDSYL